MIIRRFTLFVLVFCVFMALLCPLFGQNVGRISPYLATDHWGYGLVDYFYDNGSLDIGYYFTQPFQAQDIYYSIDVDSPLVSSVFWKDLLKKELGYFLASDVEDETRNLVQVNYRQTGISEDSRSFGMYRASVYGSFSLPYLTIVNRTVIDQAFKRDPLYYGDLREWVWGRVEDGYVLFNYKALNIFGGRTSRNWGPLLHKSMFLSDNPYSYDHYGFDVTTKKIKYSYYFTRLNDMNGRRYDSDQYQLNRRYFSTHRLDWKYSKKIQIAFSEAAIYGGPDQGFEMFYLNPMNLFYVAQRNQGVEISGLWALDWYLRPFSKINFSGQLFIDDVIVNNEPGQNDRERFPDRLGWMLNLNFVDYFFPGSSVDVVYNRISNWTYQSKKSWENYLYHNKSMGFPVNSYESLELSFSYFNKPPFIFSGNLQFYRKGENDLLQPFPLTKNKFPKGVVEYARNVNLKVSYLPSNSYHFMFEAGYESVDNADWFRFRVVGYYSWKRVF